MLGGDDIKSSSEGKNQEGNSSFLVASFFVNLDFVFFLLHDYTLRPFFMHFTHSLVSYYGNCPFFTAVLCSQLVTNFYLEVHWLVLIKAGFYVSFVQFCTS